MIETKEHRNVAKLWLPDQPGAWTMALFPTVGGIFIGGISWRNIWLLVAWTLCYCLQFTASRWLGVRSHEVKERRAGRETHTAAKRHSDIYITPAVTYLIATAIVGIPVFVFAPKLLWWIPAYIVLAFFSFLSAWLHQERSLWGNAVAVIASGTMSLLAVSLGSRFFAPVATGENLGSRLSPTLLDPTNATGYYLASPLLPKTGVIAALAFILSEYASVLFVKTMIREHGHIGYYLLSVGYHIALIALAFTAPWLLRGVSGLALPRGVFASALLWGIPAIVLLLRAMTFPLRHKRMKPVHIGMIEAITSLMNIVVIIIVLA